jgi:hypothetical protein
MMCSLILGEAAPVIIRDLSAALQQETLKQVRAIDAFEFERYTPWLCSRPALDHSLKDEPLCRFEYTRGDVVTDPLYLREIQCFLRGHHALMMSDLIGTSEDWEVLEDIENSRPEMFERLRLECFSIKERSAFFRDVFDSLVEQIIPLKQPRARGWSLDFARGAVFLGFPPDYSSLDLSLDIVHEMGHQALTLFESVDPIIASDWRAPVYSEVRHTHRPAIQSLHAAAAIAFMTAFLRDIVVEVIRSFTYNLAG